MSEQQQNGVTVEEAVASGRARVAEMARRLEQEDMTPRSRSALARKVEVGKKYLEMLEQDPSRGVMSVLAEDLGLTRSRVSKLLEDVVDYDMRSLRLQRAVTKQVQVGLPSDVLAALTGDDGGIDQDRVRSALDAGLARVTDVGDVVVGTSPRRLHLTRAQWEAVERLRADRAGLSRRDAVVHLLRVGMSEVLA